MEVLKKVTPMIKKIVMKNLTCATCTRRIEEVLVKQPYIRSATFNFTNQTMLIDVTEEYQENKHIVDIRAIVDRIESGVTTYIYERRHAIIKIGFFRSNWIIFLGLAIFLSGELLVHYFNLVRINPLYWAGYFLIAHKIGFATIRGLRGFQFFNENVLMLVATMAAMSIGKPYEAIAVIIFYTLGEHLQHRAVEQSKKEISSLMDLHVESATVLDNGDWVVKDPMSIKKNDMIFVKNGEKVPVDGIIVNGKTSLNTSALTGESKLQDVSEGQFILSGNINVGNVIEIRAAKEYQESTIAKIIDMIENATTKRSKTENFITKFAKYYTPIVTIAALLMVAIPTYFNPSNYEDYIFRAATFLVISCPCALVLSIPLSYFAGIGSSARKGILFKGSNFLDMMHEVDVIGIDKTGTLTHGNFVVDGYTNYDTLVLAATIEKYSNHPIAQSIVMAYDGPMESLSDVQELPGFGIKGTSNDGVILAGSRKFLQREKVRVTDQKDTAGTNVFVAKNGEYIGRIVIKDQIKNSSIQTIKKLLKKFRIVMLTGDNKDTASEVAYEVGGIEYRHSLLPDEKVTEFENIASKGPKMYIGDGINDAPLLKTADIGVAMGHGSEIAIDVADIIIMDDDLKTVDKAFTLAYRTRAVVLQNIVLSLGVKFAFLGLAGFGQVTMLQAIFADVGITMIAVLNALRLIYGKRAKKL